MTGQTETSVKAEPSEADRYGVDKGGFFVGTIDAEQSRFQAFSKRGLGLKDVEEARKRLLKALERLASAATG